MRTAPLYLLAMALLGALVPHFASAHEVYVLTPEQIAAALTSPAFSEWNVALENLNQFLFWGIITTLAIAGIFFISISRTLEKISEPLLSRLPPYAPFISRLSIGLGLIAASYHGALFGPELPLVTVFGSFAPFAQALLGMSGVMFIAGFFVRIAAIGMLLLFVAAFYTQGLYMLTYTHYLGELLLLLILGAHVLGYHHKGHDYAHAPAWLLRVKQALTPYALPILRVGFGVSLLYASLYAKVIHNNLALAVAETYPAIPIFFGFEPHFLVLGAAILEIVLALFFILGIEIRFAALFVEFWLALSLWYFGEAIWPHIILMGIPIAFLCYGYDKKSLEGFFMKRYGRHPVL
ncbi:MAG: hypothetical protein KBE09_03590 [Candidatus Pacebacteria bacterium]|nr:hypothetical protein [Candidatus Paceibacterota bacterium]